MPASPAGGTALGRSVLRFLACLALVAVVSFIGATSTYPQIPTWYATLAKPGWTLPNAAFPIAWTLLYLMMAVCLWRLWDRVAPSPARHRAILLFLLQLALNAIWSPVFFGLNAIWPGFLIILVLLVALAATLRACFKVDALAGWLLVPYMMWGCYAASLNGAIAVLN
ncbi:TspO/MBR family protein [Xanthobacter sp. DSM 24535]|uniref:TspO/MBR family protein n=1 Tax=Roseixanthobacter psychrophilus TaxID=3119917 RepID=UPI00372801C1